MYVLELPWLLLLLPLPWLLRRYLPGQRERQDAVRLPFFRQLAAIAGVTPTDASPLAAGRWRAVLDALAWCLLVLALAAPSRLEPPLTQARPLRDLLLAVDTSLSMETADAGAGLTRMAAVQQVLDGFIERRAEDRIGLLVFGDRPHTQAGFTQDRQALHALVAELQPGIAGPRTALGDSIGLAIRLFQNSAARERLLILLSDGSDTASLMAPDKAAEIARQAGIRIHCIGFGQADGEGEQRLDEAQLQRIASVTGGRYLQARDLTQLQAVFAELDAATPQLQEILQFQPRTPLYAYPLALALGLLLLQLLPGRSRRAAEEG